jgi:hypothetical protein
MTDERICLMIFSGRNKIYSIAEKEDFSGKEKMKWIK